MYFTNINNDELKQFKDTIIPFDFSMSLTSILNSNLFNVEDMGNNLYRICPLFYCKEIISSNSEDKFFGSQCIITIKDNTKETFYRFKQETNNENESVFDYTFEHYYPSYTLGDDLSMADFNRIVYLLRKNRKHYDNIQIKDDTSITGVYGEYIFDLEDSTVSDEGIIITPTTLENNCTVTLNNPIFHNSSYYLTLTVKKINNINLCADDDYNIETSTIKVRLVRNMPISIPFDSIELYDIISFDASVEIVHNEPILLEQSYIRLSCSSEHIDLGESVTLNAVYYNSEGSLSGKNIVFKDNGVTIGTGTTDSNGLATFVYTPVSVRSCSIVADYDNTIISNTVNVNVTKLTPNLSLSSNTDSLINGLTINISGSLDYHNNPLMGKTVKIYNNNNVLLDTVETDSNGDFNISLTASNNDMVLKAVFEGDTTYNNVESDIITINDVSSNYIQLLWEGTDLTQPSPVSNPLINPDHDVIVDYGDGTVEISHNYGHTYSTSGEHTIKIYNLTMLGSLAFNQDTGLKSVDLTPSSTLERIKYLCFSRCTNLNSINLGNVIQTLETNCLSDTGLISIIIPDSVSVIDGYVFANNNNLKNVKFKWDSSNEIITYNSNWIDNCSNFDYFSIPEGTRSLYTSKNYPSDKLVEPVTISLSASPSTIISSDTSTLSATVLDDDNNPVSGETVTFKENGVVLGTGTTNNNGVATYSYTGSIGVHDSIQAVARTIFESNSVTVTVILAFDGLELTSDKNILSYADSDKCTLTATLKNDGETVTLAGETVIFSKQTIKSTQNSITIAGEDTTLLENSINNNGDKITFTITNPSSAIALLFDETKTVSLRNLSTNDKITIEHLNGTYKVYVNNTLTESWSTDTNYSKIEIINSTSTSFTVNNYTHYNLTSIGSDYTDSAGTASYEYSSAGVGDVVFYAGCEGILSTETYSIEDCRVYDDCSSNKLNSYITNLNNGTVTYTDNSYYIARTSSALSNFNQLQVPITDLTGDVEFSVEMKLPSITGNTNAGIWLADKLITTSSNYQSMNGYGLEQYSANKGLIKYTNGSSSNVSRTTPNINLDEYYEFKFHLKNGTLTSTITRVSDESVVFTNSTSYSYSFSILFLLSNWKDTNSYYRNIKVKQL